jgi:hypothetical protein
MYCSEAAAAAYLWSSLGSGQRLVDMMYADIGGRMCWLLALLIRSDLQALLSNGGTRAAAHTNVFIYRLYW